MKGAVSLMYFSLCLSFVHKKNTHFCVLTLYPATLLKVFTCRSFLVEPLGSFIYKTISPSYKDTELFFPICILERGMGVCNGGHVVVIATYRSQFSPSALWLPGLNSAGQAGHWVPVHRVISLSPFTGF